MRQNPTPPPLISSSNIVLNLLQFDKTVSLDTNGIISYNYDPSFNNYDATATIGIDLCKFREMFGISSSYVNVDDINEDMQYYVYSNKIHRFNPSLDVNSIVVENPIDLLGVNNEIIDNHLSKDFIRYLAQLLFNTSRGTDLFINESALCNSVKSALSSAWNNCISDLQSISTNGTYQLLNGNANEYYLSDDDKSIHNICRELYTIMTKQPGRFTNFERLEITDPSVQIDGKKQYYLPFQDGDTICIKINIHPCEHQDIFGLSRQGVYTPPKFDSLGNLLGRSYLIKMKLIGINFLQFFKWSLSHYLTQNQSVCEVNAFFMSSFNYYLKYCFKNNISCYLLQFHNWFKIFIKKYTV
jgi:hypothetical protein